MDLFYLFTKNFDCETSPGYTKQHKAGRFIIEYASSKYYNIENPELVIINKKPKFKYSDIQFSISHCRDIVCVCFDKNPAGFDIEEIRPRNYTAIAERMNFKLKENSLEEFYKNWTMYEAEIKLQMPVKSRYCTNFLDKYIISAVSSKADNIKLNYIEIK